MSKSIVLKGLYLKNFKGIKELDIDFGKVTNIFGDNGTGKTTIFDAFTWLLFDKDSQDKSKFDIQPLDENNNVIHMRVTEVTAVLEIDGIKTALRKVLEEKWVKPKGKPETEFKGTTTTYYIDEVPKKQGEYKKAINDIIQEDIFKLLTNPMYFSTNLKWQDRKKALMDIIGDFTDEDVIASKKDLSPLRELLGNKNIDELKKSIAASKKKLIKDKESIPPRVDELSKTLREDIDFKASELRKSTILSDIKDIEDQLLDRSKFDNEVLKKKDKLYSLKDALKNIEYEAKTNLEKPLIELKDNLYKSNSRKMQLGRELNTIESEINYKELSIENLQDEMAELRKQYEDIQNEELHFDENMFVCPTCKRPFEAADVEAKKQEMLENFNSNQSKRLDQINVKGQAKAAKVEILSKEIQELNNKAADLNTQLSNITAAVADLKEKIEKFKPQLNLESDAEYQELKNEIGDLETELVAPSDTNSQVESLRHKKSNLEVELDGINNLLSYKEQNAALKARIVELQVKEKTLAQQIADLEKQEFLCEDFIRAKVELLESSINSKFKYVKFRFFKQQVNGGIDEDCEPLVNGVPFNTNLNSAAKVNAGLDIINTLSQHYGINAPIFVDNKESVTKLIDTDSQLINLVVSENDKKLRVESEEI